MIEAQKIMRAKEENLNSDGGDFGQYDDLMDREEGKEEEYDYFFDTMKDENAGGAQGYHVIDEDDLKDDSEDLEELDDEERQERYNEMLKDFKKSIEREDS